MAKTNPNPTTNPGMELECVNCKGQGITTTWVWNTPYGTYVGGHNELDAKDPLETNKMHPHCPVCGSHACNVLRTL